MKKNCCWVNCKWVVIHEPDSLIKDKVKVVFNLPNYDTKK